MNINLKDNTDYSYVISIIIEYINIHFPNKFHKNHIHRKFKLEDIIYNLLLFLKYGLSYNITLNGISGKTLNKYMLFFAKNDIFKNVYKIILEKYISKNKATKLKFQSIDTSYIQNKYGVSNLGRNKFYKGKRGYKLSIITDIYGIPISVLLNSCNIHDTQFVKEHLVNFLIDPETNKYKNNNRYKQYLLGDKGYDSKELQNKINEKGYEFISPKNKRNIKDKEKLKEIKMTKGEKGKYKRRIIVENSFSWIKKCNRINNIHEKRMDTYLSYVFLSLIKLVSNRLKK
jgi:transposase